MPTNGSLSAQLGAQIPTPRVWVDPNVVSSSGSDGTLYSSQNGVFVGLGDDSTTLSELYLDPALDARVELLRYRRSGKRRSSGPMQRRKGGYRHPNNEELGSPGTVDATYIGNAYRGGAQQSISALAIRTTEWPISGPFVPADATATLLSYFHQGDLTVDAPNSSTGLTETTIVPSHGAIRNPSSSPGVPKYRSRELTARFKFRISIADPDGPNGSRIVGPESVTVRMAAFPYPVWQDQVTGLWSITPLASVTTLRAFLGAERNME